jgi:hypothetical protein
METVPQVSITPIHYPLFDNGKNVVPIFALFLASTRINTGFLGLEVSNSRGVTEGFHRGSIST